MGFTSHYRGGSGPPVVLLHGFTDTWRTWDLLRPHLEHDHELLVPTLPGHAGGPTLDDDLQALTFGEGGSDQLLADGIERAMDAAGMETAHVVGNSLGGYVAMHLAERGRARSVTALAPAGGWPEGHASFQHARQVFERMQRMLVVGAPLIRAVSKSRAGRRYATRDITTAYEHLPRELVMHLARGARACPVAKALLEVSDEVSWQVRPERIACPVRIVWGTADRILLHPVAGSAYRGWFPDAEWIELDGVGHCSQLDAPEAVARIVREQVAAVEAGTAAVGR